MDLLDLAIMILIGAISIFALAFTSGYHFEKKSVEIFSIIGLVMLAIPSGLIIWRLTNERREIKNLVHVTLGTFWIINIGLWNLGRFMKKNKTLIPKNKTLTPKNRLERL